MLSSGLSTARWQFGFQGQFDIECGSGRLFAVAVFIGDNRPIIYDYSPLKCSRPTCSGATGFDAVAQGTAKSAVIPPR